VLSAGATDFLMVTVCPYTSFGNVPNTHRWWRRYHVHGKMFLVKIYYFRSINLVVDLDVSIIIFCEKIHPNPPQESWNRGSTIELLFSLRP
jgi:hypothetical protein